MFDGAVLMTKADWQRLPPARHVFRWACFDNDGHGNKIGPDDLSAPMGERNHLGENYDSWRLVEKAIQSLGRGEDVAILRAYLVHHYWKGEPDSSFKVVARREQLTDHGPTLIYVPKWLSRVAWIGVKTQHEQLLKKISELVRTF